MNIHRGNLKAQNKIILAHYQPVVTLSKVNNLSFSYQNNILGANGQSQWQPILPLLTDGQPAYIYNTESILRRIQHMRATFQQAPVAIHYAMKANHNLGLLKLLAQQKLNLDIVSQGEAEKAMTCGFNPQQMLFSGVGKSKAEILFALQNDLQQINVESLPELERIGQMAQSLKKRGRIGIRLNPDILVQTHPYITTGFRENKFGIAENQIELALRIIHQYGPWLELQGLSCHLGSQIHDESPLLDALLALRKVELHLKNKKINIQTLDLGGGFGIDYSTDNEAPEMEFVSRLAQNIQKNLEEFKGTLILEPGRWLVGRAGALCAQIEYVKSTEHKNFLITNAGMNHLIRPALYEAEHRILPLQQNIGNPQKTYDVVGPICESSDVLGKAREFAQPESGEWLAIMDAGAYGMSMSSDYNLRLPAQEILI